MVKTITKKFTAQSSNLICGTLSSDAELAYCIINYEVFDEALIKLAANEIGITVSLGISTGTGQADLLSLFVGRKNPPLLEKNTELSIVLSRPLMGGEKLDALISLVPIPSSTVGGIVDLTQVQADLTAIKDAISTLPEAIAAETVKQGGVYPFSQQLALCYQKLISQSNCTLMPVGTMLMWQTRLDTTLSEVILGPYTLSERLGIFVGGTGIAPTQLLEIRDFVSDAVLVAAAPLSNYASYSGFGAGSVPTPGLSGQKVKVKLSDTSSSWVAISPIMIPL